MYPTRFMPVRWAKHEIRCCTAIVRKRTLSGKFTSVTFCCDDRIAKILDSMTKIRCAVFFLPLMFSIHSATWMVGHFRWLLSRVTSQQTADDSIETGGGDDCALRRLSSVDRWELLGCGPAKAQRQPRDWFAVAAAVVVFRAAVFTLWTVFSVDSLEDFSQAAAAALTDSTG